MRVCLARYTVLWLAFLLDKGTRRKASHQNEEVTTTESQNASNFTCQGCNRICKSRISLYSHTKRCFSTYSTARMTDANRTYAYVKCRNEMKQFATSGAPAYLHCTVPCTIRRKMQYIRTPLKPHSPSSLCIVLKTQHQTMRHIVNECPLTCFDGGISELHQAQDAAFNWLLIVKANSTTTRHNTVLWKANLRGGRTYLSGRGCGWSTERRFHTTTRASLHPPFAET